MYDLLCVPVPPPADSLRKPTSWLSVPPPTPCISFSTTELLIASLCPGLKLPSLFCNRMPPILVLNDPSKSNNELL